MLDRGHDAGPILVCWAGHASRLDVMRGAKQSVDDLAHRHARLITAIGELQSPGHVEVGDAHRDDTLRGRDALRLAPHRPAETLGREGPDRGQSVVLALEPRSEEHTSEL